ncbi:MAG: PA2779 family protein [Thermodesulfovibrionales bacterium]|nr:PA2779 family protein [Thermodesulfovibrionales bacterium]
MLRKSVALYLVAAMFILGVAPRADAAFSPSAAIALSDADRAADIETTRAVLENKLVSQRLHDLGFSQEEINSRLSQLSDAEMHGLAQKLDSLRAGGDGLGIIIAILVIAILVVILIQLTGHRVVVTK